MIFRRIMEWVLVGLGALATVVLVGLLLIGRPSAEPSWPYLLSGFLLLILLWWDIVFHLRVLRSPAASGLGRPHRIRRPRSK